MTGGEVLRPTNPPKRRSVRGARVRGSSAGARRHHRLLALSAGAPLLIRTPTSIPIDRLLQTRRSQVKRLGVGCVTFSTPVLGLGAAGPFTPVQPAAMPVLARGALCP